MSSTVEKHDVTTERETGRDASRPVGRRGRLPWGDRWASLRGSTDASLAFQRSLGILSPLIVLGVWEVGVHLSLIDARFFPAPSTILQAMWGMLASGDLISDLGWSLRRIFLGFFGGGLVGLVVGLSMGLFRPVRIILRPLVSSTYPIPKLALLPLVLLIFGLGETSKVVLIALGTFFMVLINTQAGVLNLDNIYLDVAKNYGASRKDYYLRIALPGALPLIFTGIELGMGMALLLIVAAEMNGAEKGIGENIWTSYQTFRMEEMFVSFIVIALLGYVFAEILAGIQRRLIPWKR